MDKYEIGKKYSLSEDLNLVLLVNQENKKIIYNIYKSTDDEWDQIIFGNGYSLEEALINACKKLAFLENISNQSFKLTMEYLSNFEKTHVYNLSHPNTTISLSENFHPDSIYEDKDGKIDFLQQ